MSSGLAPGFFVAVPQLQDPSFRQSVVLLLEQSTEGGATGIVVNQESPLLLSELCQDHDLEYNGNPEKRVRQGGPVQPEQGLVLFGPEHSGTEDTHEVCEGLFVSSSKNTLGELCSLPDGRFHIYSGYAGWAPGQLESEIADGSWIIVPASASMVLDTAPSQMWELALRSSGIDPAVIVPGGGFEA